MASSGPGAGEPAARVAGVFGEKTCRRQDHGDFLCGFLPQANKTVKRDSNESWLLIFQRKKLGVTAMCI